MHNVVKEAVIGRRRFKLIIKHVICLMRDVVTQVVDLDVSTAYC